MEMLPFAANNHSALIESPKTLNDQEGYRELLATIERMIGLGVQHIIIDLSHTTRFDKEILGVFAGAIRKTQAAQVKLWIMRPCPKLEAKITCAKLTSLLPRCDT